MHCFDLNEFQREGYALWPSLLSSAQTERLVALVDENAIAQPGRGGVRDVMAALPELQAVAAQKEVRAPVEAILGSEAFVVRATLFDKTEAANWKVPWHQDLTIAVKERHDAEGYGPWSVKAGIQHVQPPSAVLQKMVTVRLHLDPCPASNGALRVMPGTHQLGRLDQNHISEFVDESLAVTCEAEAGDALIMRPLLLHTSSQSLVPAHRRVLHFDFATGDLANNLQWNLRANAAEQEKPFRSIFGRTPGGKSPSQSEWRMVRDEWEKDWDESTHRLAHQMTKPISDTGL